jgi:hypothetical protein
MAAATSSGSVGTVQVVDPHPLNWLFITWNTMEEPVRTDERGHIVGAAMEESSWVDEATLEVASPEWCKWLGAQVLECRFSSEVTRRR